MSVTKADSLFVVSQLTIEDVPAILELENACWPEAIRASEQMLVSRFELGHIFLGLYMHGRLVGLTAFSYTRLESPTLDALPKTFRAFSTRPQAQAPNSAFVYNFNMHPDFRGAVLTRKLINQGVSRLIQDGCQYLFGVARCPSFNGTAQSAFEQVEHSPRFRSAVERHLAGAVMPSTSELIVDPLLRFYRRVLHCEFLGVVPGFLPGDSASGDLGVIFMKRLTPSAAD